MKLIREDESGRTYQAKGFRIYYRTSGHVAGDNNINVHEHIYLISGQAEVRVGEDTVVHEAPAFVDIPEKTQHAIEAITDVAFIVFHPDESVDS